MAQTLPDRLQSLSFEGAVRTFRGFAATVYLLFAVLTVMQIASPGALQRIASQHAGRTLLGALAATLLLTPIASLADLLTGRERGPLEPGLSDALLHLSVAVAGLELWLGAKLLTPFEHSLTLAGLGLLLVVVGVVLGVAATRRSGRRGKDAHERNLWALRRRDALVRGAVCLMLGVFLCDSSLNGVPDLGAGLFAKPWTLPLLVATAAALLGYGLHVLWLRRVEDRLWSI
jgi:hypothetical protein